MGSLVELPCSVDLGLTHLGRLMFINSSPSLAKGSAAVWFVAAFFAGAALSFAVFTYLGKASETGGDADSQASDQPLYWVAPMDPNYRRDAPGKSPMGMDLVPVYASDESQAEGVVTVASGLANNIGLRTAKVERGELKKLIKAPGIVRYDENGLSHVHPRVSGWIEKLFITATGDPIRRGQPLYTIYSPELVNAQEEYLFTLVQGNRRLTKAAEGKLKAFGISDSAIRKLRERRQSLRSITYHAPASGVVEHLGIREGFFVKPETEILSIGSLDTVWIEARLAQADSALINKNTSVAITSRSFPDRRWQAEVDTIDPSLDAKTRTLGVRLVLENADTVLRPNHFLQVNFRPVVIENTLLVPREAVVDDGKTKRVVLRLKTNEFKSVAIETGLETRDTVQVLAGLEEGDQVLVSGQFLIDSESSKDSDFKRLIAPIVPDEGSLPEPTWVRGEILDADADERLLTISHGPIEAWGMMGMTMDFLVPEDAKAQKLFELTANAEAMNARECDWEFKMLRSTSGPYKVLDYRLGEFCQASKHLKHHDPAEGEMRSQDHLEDRSGDEHND